MLEPAAVPHLESILRNFGLTPQELQQVFSAARDAGGCLDPGKLVAKLRQISQHINKETPDAAKVKIDHQLTDKLKALGISMPAEANGDSMTLKDFIASLEQMANGSDGKNKLLPEMQTTMEQILAKVVVPGEKKQTAVSKPLMTDPDFATQTKTKEDSESTEKEERLSAFKPSARPGANEKLPTFADEKAKLNTESRHIDLKHANAAKDADLLSEFNVNRGSKPIIHSENLDGRWQAGATHITSQAASATMAEAIHSGGQQEKILQDFLPSYLVDQVGRQLTQALLKGDRIIRLRLKPPELGAVKVEMEMQDNVLRLHMIAENSSVKEVLLSNVNELRNTLAEQGVKIEGLDVYVGQDFNHSLSHSKEGLNGKQRFFKEPNRSPLVAETNINDTMSALRSRILGDRLLNLVA